MSDAIRFALLAVSLLSPPNSLQESTGMPAAYTFDHSTMPRVQAAEYKLKEETDHIFSVPLKGSVATNDHNNAITVLDLSGKRVRYHELRRDFVKYVSAGNMVFLPHFSKEWIGYSRTRGLLLFNVKTGEFQHHIIPRILQATIADVTVLDWEKRLFLFTVSFVTGIDGEEVSLWVTDLSGPEPKILSEFDIKKRPLWAELGKTSFYFTETDGRSVLHALDDRLQPINHPLLQVYNPRSGLESLGLPLLHPTLPLAVFSSSHETPKPGITVWAASWSNGAREATVHKVSDSRSGSFRFSPDGLWLLFSDEGPEGDRFVVMPVRPDLPAFLGSPILLQTSEKIPEDWNGNCAWISDPLSVVCVVSGREEIALTGMHRRVSKLLKWELTPGNIKK